MKILMFKNLKIIIGAIVVFLLFNGCSRTKDISKEAPYNQCIGKKFILKEDMYIFKFHSNSQLVIAGQHSGITGLPSLVDKKYSEDDYFGKHNHYLRILGVVSKGSIFTITQVNYEKSFESSFVGFLIKFSDITLPNILFTFPIVNTLTNPPYTPHWSDPPIFDSKYALPLPSDGIWWK